MPKKPTFFNGYTNAQAVGIRKTLLDAGLQHEEDWPRYRAEIETSMRCALAVAASETQYPLPYSPEAARQLERVRTVLSESIAQYEALVSELQHTIDAQFRGSCDRLFDRFGCCADHFHIGGRT